METLVIDFDATEERYPLLHVAPDFSCVTINHATGVVEVGVQHYQWDTSAFSIPAHLHSEQIQAIIDQWIGQFQRLHDLYHSDNDLYHELYNALLRKFAALDLGIDLSSHQMITIADQLDYIDQTDKTVDQIALELLNVERDSDCFFENEHDVDTIKQELYNIWSVQLTFDGLTTLTSSQVVYLLDFAATSASHTGLISNIGDALSEIIHSILYSARDCSSAELVDYADAIAQAISSNAQLKAVHERSKVLQKKHLKEVKKLCSKYHATESSLDCTAMSETDYMSYIVHDEAAQDLRELLNMADQKFSFKFA